MAWFKDEQEAHGIQESTPGRRPVVADEERLRSDRASREDARWLPADRAIGEARVQELPALKEYRESMRWLLEQLDKTVAPKSGKLNRVLRQMKRIIEIGIDDRNGKAEEWHEIRPP
jgi:hypothetical protein